MTAYVVEHDLVGVHRKGQVIEFSKDNLEKDRVDVERLKTLGAVREAKAEEEKHAVKYGQTNEDMPRVFPPVPFDATRPSPDPLRSEAPPTLPQEGYPDHTVEVGGEVSHKPEIKGEKPKGK